MSSPAPAIAAIVPMRHFSRRVPGKNYRLLGTKPLYRHVVDMLGSVTRITEIVVDTDSPIIMEQLAESAPHVRVVVRPPHLRDEMLTMNDILANTLSQVTADYYVQTHSTNPFLTARTLNRALDAFLGEQGRFDSLFSVTPLHVRLWTAAGQPINHDPHKLIRTQDLEPILQENSCMYIFGRSTFLACRNRIGERPLVFPMDPAEALDIDTEEEWALACASLSRGGAARA